jgi:hypothetical protein
MRPVFFSCSHKNRPSDLVKIEKCKGEKNISLQYYISVLKYESTRGCGLDGRAAGMEVTE